MNIYTASADDDISQFTSDNTPKFTKEKDTKEVIEKVDVTPTRKK